MTPIWFRFYNNAVHDPKVQRLSGDKFKAWINMLCLASENGGILPSVADLSYTFRQSEDDVSSLLDEFYRLGLFDEVELEDAPMSYTPHNWTERQYKSDVSTPRVKRFWEKERNVSPPKTETFITEQSRVDQNKAEADARTDFQKRAGDFRQALVRAYSEANSPTLPDTSRAELWLSQGYQEDICLAVISEIVRRKPNATLAYFDKPIAEAHAKRAPPRKAVNGPAPLDWDAIMQSYKMFGKWSRDAGNDPSSPSCRAPPEIMRKYGFEPVTTN